ncbi:MAG: hypothetical protein QGI84_03595 [Dehalococcoidia bacterium]|nr:hypothetical protein [Dehalococcoidia bacterium]
MSDHLTIGGKTFTSRLMTGTGKHRSPEDLVASVEASGTEIITVAIRRLGSKGQEILALDEAIDKLSIEARAPDARSGT